MHLLFTVIHAAISLDCDRKINKLHANYRYGLRFVSDTWRTSIIIWYFLVIQPFYFHFNAFIIKKKNGKWHGVKPGVEWWNGLDKIIYISLAMTLLLEPGLLFGRSGSKFFPERVPSQTVEGSGRGFHAYLTSICTPFIKYLLFPREKIHYNQASLHWHSLQQQNSL